MRHVVLQYYYCYVTVFARKRDIAVPAERNGELQTLILVCPRGETQTTSHIVESCPDKTEWRLISATLCR